MSGVGALLDDVAVVVALLQPAQHVGQPGLPVQAHDGRFVAVGVAVERLGYLRPGAAATLHRFPRWPVDQPFAGAMDVGVLRAAIDRPRRGLVLLYLLFQPAILAVGRVHRVVSIDSSAAHRGLAVRCVEQGMSLPLQVDEAAQLLPLVLGLRQLFAVALILFLILRPAQQPVVVVVERQRRLVQRCPVCPVPPQRCDSGLIEAYQCLSGVLRAHVTGAAGAVETSGSPSVVVFDPRLALAVRPAPVHYAIPRFGILHNLPITVRLIPQHRHPAIAVVDLCQQLYTAAPIIGTAVREVTAVAELLRRQRCTV